MKKIIAVTSVILFVLLVSITFGEENELIYDYRTEPTDEKAGQAIGDHRDEIQQFTQWMGCESATYSSADALESRAVRVYQFEVKDFLEKLTGNKGLDGLMAEHQEREIWKIPVDRTPDGLVTVTIWMDQDGETSLDVKQGLDSLEGNNDFYLFEPELVGQILEQQGITSPEVVLPVWLPEAHSDVVCVRDGRKEYLIFFSARPDFVKVENGVLYPMEEGRGILENYCEQQLQ